MERGRVPVVCVCAVVLWSLLAAESFSRDVAENAAFADSPGSPTLSIVAGHPGANGPSATTARAGADPTSSTLVSPRMFVAEFLIFSVEASAPPDFISTLDKAIREDRTFQLATARNYERQGYLSVYGNPRVGGTMGDSAGADLQIGAGPGGKRLRLQCNFEPADTPAEVRCAVTMVYLDRGSRAANVREVFSILPGITFHFVKLFRFAPAAGEEAAPWIFLLKIEEVE